MNVDLSGSKEDRLEAYGYLRYERIIRVIHQSRLTERIASKIGDMGAAVLGLTGGGLGGSASSDGDAN